MANLSHGMNVEDIKNLGNNLKSKHAEQVRGLMSEIEKMVNATSNQWVGGDADKFRSWWPAKRAAMKAIADDLQGFGQSALNNASEQERVSGR